MKNKTVYWVNFDKDDNKSSLSRKLRPAFIIRGHNNQGIFIVPLTTVEKPYHAQNPFSVKLDTKGYALCDQYETVARTDIRIKNQANYQLTEEKQQEILLTLEKYMSLSMHQNLNTEHKQNVFDDLNVGDTVHFKEMINGKSREIIGVVKAIDSSISQTPDEDYILLHVKQVIGSKNDQVYENKINIIRTREDMHGWMNQDVGMVKSVKKLNRN